MNESYLHQMLLLIDLFDRDQNLLVLDQLFIALLSKVSLRKESLHLLNAFDSQMASQLLF